jgi:hypothetical protein
MMAISASARSGDEGADPVSKVASSTAAADAVLTLSGHELTMPQFGGSVIVASLPPSGMRTGLQP